MNPQFLTLIFAMNLNMADRDTKRLQAKQTGYTMFHHNGEVHSVSDMKVLFNLNALILDMEKFSLGVLH